MTQELQSLQAGIRMIEDSSNNRLPLDRKEQNTYDNVIYYSKYLD
jgi:hypothetical protein